MSAVVPVTDHPARPLAPAVPGGWLLGSALDLKRDVLGSQVRAMREVGDVVRFVVGPPGARRDLHVFYAPEAVQRVLAARSARYRKDNRFYQHIRWAFGDGLLTSQDEVWLRQKRFLQPVFTRQYVADYVPIVAAEADRLVRRWREPARDEQPVDLHPATTAVALRVVGRALFGADLDAVAPVLDRGLPALSGEVFRSSFSAVPTPRSWPTPANRRAARTRRALYRVVDELVAARRAAPQGHADDLLGRLLRAGDARRSRSSERSEPATPWIGSAGDAGLGDEEVRDQLMIFMFAGHDTTATALTFAMHLLGHHPWVQRRAHDEVRAVLADRPVTADDVPRLPYVAQVLKEAMRLFPSAYGMGRRVADGDQVDGYLIRPGSEVGVYPWATHRHPRHWDDAERFDPDRFAPDRESKRHRYAWFPFGGGPRACIGAQFAMVEATTVLATVLRQYELSTPAGPVRLRPRITLHPAAPMPCRLRPRPGRS
jgi:cytochrome P450